MSNEREQAQELVTGFYNPLIKALKRKIKVKEQRIKFIADGIEKKVTVAEIQGLQNELNFSQKAVEQIQKRWKI